MTSRFQCLKKYIEYMELDQTLHQLYLVTNYVVRVRVARVVKFQEGDNTNGTYLQIYALFKRL